MSFLVEFGFNALDQGSIIIVDLLHVSNLFFSIILLLLQLGNLDLILMDLILVLDQLSSGLLPFLVHIIKLLLLKFCIFEYLGQACLLLALLDKHL